MSSQNIVLNTGSQAIINNEVSKIFVFDNRYTDVTYTNSGYSPVTLPAGTLMGRIATTGKVVPLTSAAVNGSQFPVGVLADDYIVNGGDTVTLSICTSGDVAQDKVILQGSDTMDTAISGRTIRDRIGADTVGINLVGGTEMTAYDNS